MSGRRPFPIRVSVAALTPDWAATFFQLNLWASRIWLSAA